MTVQASFVAIALGVTTVVSAVTALFLWKNMVGSASKSSLKNANYAQVLVLVLIAQSALGQLILVTVDSGAWREFGIYLTSVSMIWAGSTWFVFAYLYTGRGERLTRPVLAALVGITTALTVALVTNGIHGQTIHNPEVLLATSESTVDLELGTATWVAAIYTWIVSGIAIKFLIDKFLTSRNVYRKISFMHAFGGSIYNLGGFLSVVGISPIPHLSLAPVAFSVIILLTAPTAVTYRYLQLLPLDRLLTVFGSRFRSLTPMARDTIIENMDSGMLVVDHSNRLVDINPLGRRMIAAEDRRVVGKPLKEVVPPEVFEGDNVGFLDPTTVDETYRGIWTSAAAEERRCFDFQITALGSTDEPAGRAALVSDVTDREIRKQQLEQRTRELERQNEQLEQFAGIVSHDLRNPLNVAKGYIDAAHDVDDPGRMLDEAEQSLDRMEAIIEDVLTLARDGQTIGSTESVSLDEIVRRAWENVSTPNSTLEVQPEAGDTGGSESKFEADPDRLLNVFENLFRNSVEHSDGPVTVTVGLLEDGFYVADDGPGIPRDRRSDVTTFGYTTSDHGTGFGLAIVEQVAQAHTWTLTVTESGSGGARFEFHDVPKAGTSTPASRHLD